jgi:Tol biopolymer transport system component/predicted Ser/Thr protein kinase
MEKRASIAERIFGEALEVPRAERSAFLDRACRGAPEVRRVVEDLLAENDRLSGFLSASPYEKGEGNTVAGGVAGSLAAGTRLGRYVILEPLGAGGMGVVYRARDEKLERVVAIKMLPSGVLTGEEARRHFRREALALAKLNHPRIASVYDVGEEDGADYIVMELVEGESLAAKLRAGALPVKHATAITLQVAEALVEAHERGVIHRDLKPGNVMITPKGNAKVLDFGLAKMLAPLGGETATSLAETRGVMGTPLYMSPEQALGKSVDARTDLWSLGVVYYECLAGRPPFRGDSSLAVLHAITAEGVAPLLQIRPDAPVLAEHIVTRALEKDPELRYQRAADVETDLKRLMRDLEPRAAGASGTTSAVLRDERRLPTGRRRAISLMGVATVVAVLALAYIFRPTVPPPRLTGMRQLTHDGTPKRFLGLPGLSLPMFTDGPRVYFAEFEVSRLNVMQVSTLGGESQRVPVPFDFTGVMDLSVAQSKLLLQTPTDASATFGTLWTMPLPAGQPQSNGKLAVFDAQWSPDGDRIYYTRGSELWVARNDESQPRKILTGQNEVLWVRFSHDGQRIRFTAFDGDRNTSALWEAKADGSHLQPVLAGWDACCGSWTPDGKYFVFASTRGGSWNLWAMREKREWWRRTDPEPARLTVGQMTSISPLPGTDGKTIFFIGSTPRGELVRYDLQKRLFVPYLPGLSAEGLAFSHDGSRVAWTTVPEGTLWQSKADGTERHELTFPPMQGSMPRWSPDGTQIAFSAQEPGKPSKICVVPAGGGFPEQVTEGESNDFDPSWSPGGDALAFGGYAPTDGSAQYLIRIVNLTSRALTTLPDSRNYFSPRWSPDGRWLLALDHDTNALELYNFTTRTWERLTKLDASYPNWTADSQCILFDGSDDTKQPPAPPETAPAPVATTYYRVCLADRKPQLLVNLGEGGQLVSATFNFWTGVTPDGSILGVRDISTEDVYALDVELP